MSPHTIYTEESDRNMAEESAACHRNIARAANRMAGMLCHQRMWIAAREVVALRDRALKAAAKCEEMGNG